MRHRIERLALLLSVAAPVSAGAAQQAAGPECGGGTPQATLRQEPSPNARGNLAVIFQSGDGGTARIDQQGERNVAAARQDGDGSTLVSRQVGAENVLLARVAGNDATVDLAQRGERNLDVVEATGEGLVLRRQVGPNAAVQNERRADSPSGPCAAAEERADAAEEAGTPRSGGGNRAVVRQGGANGTVTIIQRGPEGEP